jgi:hypothetical protein
MSKAAVVEHLDNMVVFRKDTSVTYSPGTPKKFTVKRHNIFLSKRKDSINIGIRNDGYDADGNRQSVLTECRLDEEDILELISELQQLLVVEEKKRECYTCAHFTHTKQGFYTVGYCKLKGHTTNEESICDQFKGR